MAKETKISDNLKLQRTEQLLLEQKNLLELVANDQSLEVCLNELTAAISRLEPKTRAAVLIADDLRKEFKLAYAAGIPPSFGEGIHNAPINDLAIGTCGTAVYYGKPMVCSNISQDEKWSKMWRDLCVSHDILACYSQPVFNTKGEVIASLMLCFNEAREPAPWERQLSLFGKNIASIAIERAKVAAAEKKYLLRLEQEVRERKLHEQQQKYILKLSDALRSIAGPVAIEETVTRLAMNYFESDRCYYCTIEGGNAIIRRDALRGDLPSVAGTYPLSSFPLFKKVVEEGGPFVVHNAKTSDILDEALRKFCLKLQVISFIDIPVIKNGKAIGILCLVQSTPRNWKESEIQLATETTERIWAAVERAKAEEALRINEVRMRWQKEAFQSAINGASLADSLNIIAQMVIEETKGEARTAFYLADGNNACLHPIYGAGNMSELYLHKIDGFVIGEDFPAYGRAVSTEKPVLTPDVFEDPLWKPWLYLAEEYGFRGCWSFPIKTRRDNNAIGTFAMHFNKSRGATTQDYSLADIVTRTAAVIISSYNEAQRRARAEEALRESKTRLAEELDDSKQLQQISSKLIEQDNIQSLYEQILDAAIDVMHSDMGSLQMLIPEKNELQLLIGKGLDPQSSKFWQQVTRDSKSTCGIALSENRRVMIADVDECDFMAGTENLDHYHLSGIKAVQSTPLISRSGKIIGMISNHWHKIYYPSEHELALLDMLARQAADLMEKRQAEEALQKSETHLSAIFTQAEVGISEVSSQGRFLRVNDKLCQILDRSREEMLQLSIPDVVFKEDLPHSLTALKQLIETGKPVSLDERYVRLNGEKVWTNNALSFLEKNPHNKHTILVITTDITERKNLDRQKDEFIGVASHELKTPVTSIQIYAEMLQQELQEAHDEQNMVIAGKLNEQVNRLTKLIYNLLDTTRIFEGKLKLELETFDLNKLIEEHIEELQLVASSQKLIFKKGRLKPVSADRERIGQVLINLISNAIKYSEENSEVIISSEDAGNSALIRVKDSGMGMPAATKEKVFERFFRSDDPKASTFPGIGLGLYIASEIIKQHGGMIGVESEPEKGTEFYFKLPYG